MNEDIREKIKEKLDKIINNHEITKTLEIGIFNSAIRLAENYGVVKKWDNKLQIKNSLKEVRKII